MRNGEMPEEVSQGPRLTRGVALGISVFLHVLLLTLGWWFPAASEVSRRSPEPVPRDSVLNFTFVPPPSEVAKANPSGQVPQVTVPRPVPPAPKTPAGGPRTAGEPTARDESKAASPTDGARETGPGEAQNEIPPDPNEENARPRPPLDLGRAVRDFGETLEQAPRNARRGTGGTSTFVPEPGQFPTTGYGLGNLAFETRDFDWSDYGRQIYIAIWRAWHNRLYQTVDDFEKWAYGNGWFLDHENRIRFVIERSGQVTGIVIEAESGCVPLDASATQALAEVILPPLPEEFPKQREVVHARFLAEGSIREMRPSLARLKRYGLF